MRKFNVKYLAKRAVSFPSTASRIVASPRGVDGRGGPICPHVKCYEEPPVHESGWFTGALSVSFAAVLLLASIPAAQADGEKIAMFTKNQINPYFQSMRLGADAGAKEMNASVIHYVPNKPDNIAEQLAEVEDVVTKKPNAVVFIPVDSKALVVGMEKLTGAGIPVVNLLDRTKGSASTFVGVSDIDLGIDTARVLFKKLNGKGNVIFLEGVKGALSTQERLTGFKKALEEFPGIKLLASQTANAQRLMALQVMENLLQAHPQVDGVLAATDSMAMGAIEALDGANRKALVAAVNGTKEAVDAIKAGKLLATGDSSPFMQGCVAAMAAVRAARKLPLPKEIIFPIKIITAADVKAVEENVGKCPKWETMVKN